MRARSIWAECRRDLPERACRAEGVEERLSRRRRKRKKGGAAPTWHSRGTRDSDLDSRIAVSGQKATQMSAGIFSLRKTVERREKKIAPVERMSVPVWRRPDDSLSLGDYSCCDAIQRKGMLRARLGIPYLPVLRVVPDFHLDSSTCKSARSRASQSRHHAPRVLKGSSARIVLRDIEKRSPSTTIGECPYRAFFRLAEALEGLADGKTLSSKLEKICERA